MGAEVLSSVATSVDPTWIGAMLFTYPVQFILWSLLVGIAAFVLGFAWEKRKVGIAKAETDLMRTQHEIDVKTMKSIQEANKELLEFNRKLINELSEARESLSASTKDNKELLELTESVHETNKKLLNELKESKHKE